MILGKIVGNVVSTLKHGAFKHQKMLMVQPVTPQQAGDGPLVLAVDLVGAGDGDLVVVSTEEGGTGQVLGLPPRSPVRSLVVGIVDRVDLAYEPA